MLLPKAARPIKSEIRRTKMSIKIRNALRKSLSRVVFSLLILLPMGAAMAASKSAPKPNPFLQNPAQPVQAGPYTSQNGVVVQGAPVAAVQGVSDASSASTSTSTSTSISISAGNATPRRGTPQQAGSGGGGL
jgi:hypothetical protein